MIFAAGSKLKPYEIQVLLDTEVTCLGSDKV